MNHYESYSKVTQTQFIRISPFGQKFLKSKFFKICAF